MQYAPTQGDILAKLNEVIDELNELREKTNNEKKN